jgi:hypothetical protein
MAIARSAGFLLAGLDHAFSNDWFGILRVVMMVLGGLVVIAIVLIVMIAVVSGIMGMAGKLRKRRD